MNKKYYLMLSDCCDDEEDMEDGWLYTKTPKGKYLIQALLCPDLEHSFWNRKQLLKEHSVVGIHEEYDYKTRPPGSVRISPTRAKRIIRKWKKISKELWND